MKHCFKFFVLFLVLYIKLALARSNNAFDLDLYENVLDPVECERQLTYIRNNDNNLRIRFLDASWRIPRSLLKGNTRDLGNYFQCLEINRNVEVLDMAIEGKFCAMRFPFQQDNFELPPFPTLPVFPNITWPDNNVTIWSDLPWPETIPELPWRHFDPKTYFTEENIEKLRSFEQQSSFVRTLVGDTPEDTTPARIIGPRGIRGIRFELAICIPKVCTARQTLDFLSNNLTRTLDFEERYCRLPNDKKWVAVDTVAVVVLSIIGFITILSTAYDINHTMFQNKDPKQASKLYKSFSVYTNGKNFFIFPSGPGVVTCLDGIRSFAMIWVIIGHTFLSHIGFMPENILDIIQFMMEFSSLYITSAPITVDTFFLISGLLVVYTSASKMSAMTLIKNLHLFYLNRLLRMFPVLAFGILMTASFIYRTVDGPNFIRVAPFVNNCRNNWWSTLLYVQNFVHPFDMCIPQSWYLAIDMQLYFFSPIVLVWILGQRRRTAWFGIWTALIGVMIAAGVYNFLNNFQSATVGLGRPPTEDYMPRYYVHTLPRAAPFFVGMVFGYLLHIYRDSRPKISVSLALFYWVLALAATTGACIITYWNIQPDWDNQLLDNIINTVQRPIWAAGVGWIIFACHHGYGGPVNWLLSLTVFRILGRLSYAMYILHYVLIYLINATNLTPMYFSTYFVIYRFFLDFTLAAIAAFLVTILIDLPFTNLIKMGMDLVTPKMQKPQPKERPSLTKEDPEMEYIKEEPRIDIESMKVEDERKTRT